MTFFGYALIFAVSSRKEGQGAGYRNILKENAKNTPDTGHDIRTRKVAALRRIQESSLADSKQNGPARMIRALIKKI